MALQIVAVDDTNPGACIDTGLVYNGSTTITSSKIIAGTSMTMSGYASVAGDSSVGGDFTVGGTTIISGACTLLGDFTVGTNNFKVDAAFGHTEIAGTLDVHRVSTFHNAVSLGAQSAGTLSGTHNCNLEYAYHGFTTNATADLVLVVLDGTVGQHLWLKMEDKNTNNVVVTPTNLEGGSTITLDATEEYVQLVFAADSWHVLGNTGTLA